MNRSRCFTEALRSSVSEVDWFRDEFQDILANNPASQVLNRLISEFMK